MTVTLNSETEIVLNCSATLQWRHIVFKPAVFSGQSLNTFENKVNELSCTHATDRLSGVMSQHEVSVKIFSHSGQGYPRRF